jgi:uncharacterized protein
MIIRAPLPDVLRGGALMIILCVNMQDFAGYTEWTQRGADRAAQVFIDVFLNGKGVSIFAMLFGAGAFALLERGGRSLLLRRLLVLLIVGSLHYVLVWHGDIIANYAVVGVSLVLLERARPWLLTLLGSLACGGWLLSTGLLALTMRSAAPRVGGPGAVLEPYLEALSGRAGELPGALASVVAFDGFWIAGLFCLGGALYRSGLLWWPAQHRPALRWFLGLGLAVGLPLSGVLAYLNTLNVSDIELWALIARFLGGLAGALAYIGGAGLLAASGRLGVLRHLAASGRLALSNYLAQSLIMTSLFYGYGLGQGGQWGAFPALLLALAFGAAQVGLSALYLRRFRVGPAEWLVRALVYGRISRRPE